MISLPECKNAAISTNVKTAAFLFFVFPSCQSAHRNSLYEQLLVHVESSLEAVNTSAGINELLTAGKEGVALGTNFHADILLCGTGMDNLAASTRNGRIYIFWMDSVFHFCFTSL